jgi:ABC-type proline/glycine betaine transport system permease subunit
VTRRVTIFLSLATIAVGSWLIAKEHSMSAVCSSIAATGVGLGYRCMNAVASYFMGFALIAGGLLILMLAVFLMSKREDHRRWRKEKAAVIKLRHEEADKLRKAA